MKRTYIDRERILKRVIHCAHSSKKIAQLDLFCDFVRVLYQAAPLDSLDAYEPKDLYGAARSLWNFSKKRRYGDDVCCLFNADAEPFPWQCEHTLVAVVTDTKPFLIDSIRMALAREGCSVYSFINGTAMNVERTRTGMLKSLSGAQTETSTPETFLLIEINYTAVEAMGDIEAALLKVLHNVHCAVRDWHPMQLKMKQAMDQLDTLPEDFSVDAVSETKAFFNWLLEYFTFIGYREYRVEGSGDTKALVLIPDSGLGVLTDQHAATSKRYYNELPQTMRERSLSKDLILISKTNTLSTLHRPTYTDIIICKLFDAQGVVIGERRFIGLFTSDAYDSDPTRIPLLRQRVTAILDQSLFPIGLYERKRLIYILKHLPRDDLFQATLEELQAICMGVLDIQERRITRLFARKDICNRFVSCLVYLPRDNYSTELRIKMQRVLMESFHGQEITFKPVFSESSLTAVHFVIRVDPKQEHIFDIDEIERKIIELARSWHDEFESALLRLQGSAEGHRLFMAYQWSFSPVFRSLYSGTVGAELLEMFEGLGDLEPLSVNLITNDAGHLLLRIAQLDAFFPLSDAIPILENMGLRTIGERLFEIQKPDNHRVYMSEFIVECPIVGSDVLNSPVREAFHEALKRVWSGQLENDRFNQLILSAGLQWFEVRILRAYARYLKQIGFSLSETYIQSAFSELSEISQKIIQLFHIRFDPKYPKARKAKFNRLKRTILQALDEVKSADQDRIIRYYLLLLEATVRVNVFKVPLYAEPCFAFKIDSGLVPDLPLPKPLYEIFVFSERVEGIHLRAGKVARGGIRWSDRKEDFRTEVLGLMKAQQGKNSLIVPAGAKGGFIAKRNLTGMSSVEAQEEAIVCYKVFISGLLDLTDNLSDGKIIKPSEVVVYDGDDPYLVVAADRGTATFSDIANELSKAYGFWLMDAFASGGSTGYDHKKMGITARGAWASVQWHFQSLNRNINAPFSVIGIGGMAGDVFGNGMLLSKQIRLLAAFNHQYIFIDPTPNPAKSFKERRRLFALGSKGCWSDYSQKVLSAGGAVYGRHDKCIMLSPQAQKALGLEKKQYSPEALIQKLLCAKVDLIWNGGIGTFVRASTETDIEVGDHSNDAVRVSGHQLRCKMFGEGGNLGLTQLGRIEYALSGGLINTDFIDNSGGVDCSDHEVNIKIFLNDDVQNKRLSLKERNRLLKSMTDDVAQMVLKHNLDQNLALTLEAEDFPSRIYLYQSFIKAAVNQGALNPSVENLPTKSEMEGRLSQKQGLTRPELAVLLSYSKIILQEHLLTTVIVDSEEFKDFLLRSFPQVMLHKLKHTLWRHPLRREIIATHLSNTFINELGLTFLTELQEECSVSIADAVSAYVVVRELLNVNEILQAIRSNEQHLPFDALLTIYKDFRVFLAQSVRWFLGNRFLDLTQKRRRLSVFLETAASSLSLMPQYLEGPVAKKHHDFYTELIDHGIRVADSKVIARIKYSYACLNIVDAALTGKVDVSNFAPVYCKVSYHMHLHWLRNHLNMLALESSWDLSARYTLKGHIDSLQQAIALKVYADYRNAGEIDNLDAFITQWFDEHREIVSQWETQFIVLMKRNQLTFSIIFVLLNELKTLIDRLEVKR